MVSSRCVFGSSNGIRLFSARATRKSAPISIANAGPNECQAGICPESIVVQERVPRASARPAMERKRAGSASAAKRSEEHTSELQSRLHLVCRLLLEKKKKQIEVQEWYGHTTKSQRR